MASDHFDIVILNARPAAGKSEIIDYLKHVSPEARLSRFHVGVFQEIDDFPMLWTWFEEDDILERLGHPRLHSTPDGYFTDDVLWQVLIERICLNYGKLVRDQPDFHREHTAIIEFSRGAQHGGYQEAYQHLSDDVLKRAAVLYLDVPYEESLRKNRRRFNPDRPDSILQHALPDKKLEQIYKLDDFAAFTAADSQYLTVRGIQVPYVVFENHDDVTTDKPQQLGERLEARLNTLWERYQSRPS
jgi:hypothetical protein